MNVNSLGYISGIISYTGEVAAPVHNANEPKQKTEEERIEEVIKTQPINEVYGETVGRKDRRLFSTLHPYQAFSCLRHQEDL